MQHCPGNAGREPSSWVCPWMEEKGFTFFDLLPSAVTVKLEQGLSPSVLAHAPKVPRSLLLLCLNLSYEIDLDKTPEPKKENMYLLYPKQTLHKGFSSLTTLFKARMFLLMAVALKHGINESSSLVLCLFYFKKKPHPLQGSDCVKYPTTT